MIRAKSKTSGFADFQHTLDDGRSDNLLASPIGGASDFTSSAVRERNSLLSIKLSVKKNSCMSF